MLDWIKSVVEKLEAGTFTLIILPLLVAIAGFIHIIKSKSS
ncbi:hypothetical protein CPJCM30710_17800 [Clostridium polyendosporum]|uniref:Uncharacterized protein n=1 Tax=Clostridium polyendosporum TaxID=69208 RepID=A0A919VEF9_9CLOT|nr:hypothetical protein [Clostridium polyendosporum]GIM29114.1 hypothetical protein CPJCM30710_17800 [Clostridium polyendosporum]